MERKVFLQAQLSRPLILGALLGCALGDPLGGLMVAAPLELLWLGSVQLGAASPQHETAASAAIVTTALAAGADIGEGAGASIACLAFLLCAPLGIVGMRLERVAEKRSERRVQSAEDSLARAIEELAAQRASRGEAIVSPAAALVMRSHLAGFWWPLLLVGLLVTLSAVALGPLVAAVWSSSPLWLESGLSLGWGLVWAVGGAAALRVARMEGSFALAAAGAIATLGLWALGALL